MIDEWLTSGWEETPMVIVSAIAVYAAILVYTRVVGLRSLSKMSAADFAMTVAVGSLFASSVSSPSPSVVVGLTALASLYAGQFGLAVVRQRSSWANRMVDNQPLLLMANGIFLEENLKQANVTRDDVFGKLREANALNYDEVLAVVFETTGDVSVLHSPDKDAVVEPDFIDAVIGAEHLTTSRAPAKSEG